MTNRERFEATMGAKLDLEPYEYADGSFHYYADRVTQLCFEAWQKACPEGWQTVPIIWPESMAKRLAKDIGNEDALCVWAHHKCMLAAAPKPEDV